MKYQIVVGNIGTVFDDDNGFKARAEFGWWKRHTQQPCGRGSGEDVTLFEDGEILYEHIGEITKREMQDA